MHNIQEISIEQIIAHFIGSKTEEEGVQLSSATMKKIDEDTETLLKHYFFNSFKSGEYFHFSIESETNPNYVHECVSAIFNDTESFVNQSRKLGEYLYEQSEHPKIKTGELYVVYFSNCIIDGEIVDAVGLFKSESKDSFIKVTIGKSGLEISPEIGININKLDKGCIVYNTESEKGYLVSIVDSASKGAEARYWRDNFLYVKTRKDEYYQTKSYLDMCKSFVVEQAPKEFEVSKADQVDFLNKSANFFKTNQDFDMNSFTHEVMPQPEVAESFKEYKKQYEVKKDLQLEEEFMISMPAVKKEGKVLKSVIKLDKNFHIYVHGNRENIVKGFDEKTGLNYYQIYFKDEE